ncbi:FAD-binding protein [Lactobacillus johnsonii]|uniref:FAD-binding protein n=1 Tax=Lactobacillus johnsonii TaxID=33959 RepID=UPI001C11A728|nr:FAD-binding protein [Lactobacillus johnsonii]MBU5317983.1 FAD-binding protein [Lactobacillus johnsonii]
MEDKTKNPVIDWKANYDVVVLGFGGAGATAARFAADNGANVLLVDIAPYGHEGGNTRYSAQLLGTGTNFDELKEYYLGLTHPMDLPEDMVDTYVHGMCNMREYVKNYLGVEPVSFINEFKKIPAAYRASVCQEYPELKGHEAHDYTLVHNGWFDAALWKLLRQKILDRKDKIDVWYEARAKHLIQDPVSKVIKGVQIEKLGQKINVLARKGVILTTGGFENNKEMIQNYLDAPKLAPLGTIYNKGDGISMAQEVGAKMWHMDNYESLGLLHGLSFATPEGERSELFLSWLELNHGSIFMVVDDGKRYFDETTPNRHGHIFDHGAWRVPRSHEKPYIVFDQKQYEKIESGKIPYDKFNEKLIKAASLKELANKIEVNADGLKQQVEMFNRFVKNGHDDQFGRNIDSMASFAEEGPYYAIKMAYNVLNTQGGPERNTKAQILDANNEPIPHLFGAGELGGINANKYQGGGNLAECLIFGKIAGEEAAKVTNEVTDKASDKYNGINELADGEKINNIKLGKDQYLGESNAGIGGKLVVRVTYDNGIKNVEVVQNHESEDVGKKALKVIPERIVKENKADVDAVSGASATSRAISEAVSKAVKKAKKEK